MRILICLIKFHSNRGALKMSGEVLQLYISEQLHKFRFGQRCCMKLLGFLFSLERQHFLKSANDLSLHMRTYVYDGQEIVIVFKDSCHHMVTDPFSLKVHPDYLKELYSLHCGVDFNGYQKEVLSNSSVEHISSRTALPAVPPHRFSLGPLKQSIARSNPYIQQNDQDSSFDACKEIILSNLATHRVLIINGGPRCNMSTIIPPYIINKCAEEKIHCKIICVEREQLVAIYNSELVAERFQEKVGETVAYQIQLQSRISDSSNLVYTTSFFLLRVLMGQSIVDSFRHISHVIVVDVHFHEAYADLLLRELKEALKYHPHLKVILLSSSSKNNEFLNYFGEGKELFMLNAESGNMLRKAQVLYLDDICKNLSDNRISTHFMKTFYALPVRNGGENNNNKHLDKCLGAYERFGSDHCFESLLYMFTGECCDINYRHSITGRTAIIIASMLGNFSHVQTLLQLNANPRINDYQGTNALTAALSMGYKDCVEILQISQYEQSIMPLRGSNKDYIDYYLIIDIIQMIYTNATWKPGNVIVFLPSYQHLVKLNYIILKQKILGNISEKLMVFLLHNQIEKSDLDIIIQRSSSFMKLILATEVAESLTCFDDIKYVIDTARNYRLIYNYQNMSKEYVYEWSSKCSAENRTMIRNSKEDIFCFRLITKSKYNQLSELPTPEMLNIYLDRVCLSVKLLSPNNMISEYLQDTIVKPPFLHIHRTIEILKKINVFTELEDMTWLGCRLIDVPVECYLGKILVFAILLQCLDPILTIVGFMSTLDPFELCHYVNDITDPYRNMICCKIKEEKERLSEGILSDHLVYLRLYQEWQNDFRDEDNSPELNEYHFTLSGLLEQVCNVRTQLVGSLRSSQLIHSKGNLSMHYINLKSNSWPVIKAALVGGMYPNICAVDFNINRIKSPCRREIVLHPHSVLRSIELNSMSSLSFNSPWIIYGKEKNGYNCNSVECNTIVTPITVALFAGPTRLSSSNLQIIVNQQESSIPLSFLHIDDWITFAVDYKEAQLLLKTRQIFFSIYENYLQNCGFLENHKRPHTVLNQNVKLFDCIEKLLTQEDVINGFSQPEKIGLRPKALPNQFMMRHNAFLLITSHCYKTSKNKQLFKQFFMIYKQESNDGNSNCNNTSNTSAYCNNDWYHVLKEIIPPRLAENKLTFVISFSLNPDLLRRVYVAEWRNGILKLHLCFKTDISLHDILNQMPVKSSFSLSINSKRTAFQVDNTTGEFFVNLFAAHNDWIHA